ncbi:MAG: phage tail tube protein, partial [Opitutae bacterium]
MAAPTTSAGFESTIGIGEESTYGTAVAATAWYHLTEPPTFDPSYPRNLKRTMGGQFTRKAIDARREPTVSFKVITSYDGFGWLLKHAIGDSSVSTSGAGPYTHTIAASTMPVGLTIEADYGAASLTSGTTMAFTGAMIEKLTLTQAHGDFLEVSVDAVAESVDYVTKAAVSYPTDNFLEYSGLGTATINSNAQFLRNLELTINNDLRADRFAMGSKTRNGLDRKTMTVTGSAEVDLDSMDEINLAVNGTDTAMTFTWSGASSHSLSMALSGSNIMSANPSASGEDDYTVSIEFDA